MPSAIAGTTSWTADSSSNGSFIAGSGSDANFRWGRGAFNPAETYWYSHCRNGTGKLFRIDLTGANAGKITVLYTGTGIPTTGTAIVVSPDGATLYVFCQQVTALQRVYTLAADGSSGSATEVYTESNTNAPVPTYDPVSGRILVADASTRYLGAYDPTAWAARAVYHYPAGLMIPTSIGLDYGNPDALLWASDSNFFSGVYRFRRSRGHSVCLVGSQAGGSGGTGGDPFAIATGACRDPWCDASGHVYYVDGANTVRLLDEASQVVSTILASSYISSSGMGYLPTTNALIVCNNQTAKKVT